MFEYLLFLVIGLVAGFFIGLLIMKLRPSKSVGSGEIDKLERGIEALRQQKEEVQIENGSLSGRLEKSERYFVQQQTQIVEQTEKLNQLNGRAERLEAEKLSLETRIAEQLSLIHISEPTRRTPISYAVFCLKKKLCRRQVWWSWRC